MMKENKIHGQLIYGMDNKAIRWLKPTAMMKENNKIIAVPFMEWTRLNANCPSAEADGNDEIKENHCRPIHGTDNKNR